jgi:hypothetical protein
MGPGVDLLIDFLAGPMVNGNLLATRVGGRMINIGRLAGENGDCQSIKYIHLTRQPRLLNEWLVTKASERLSYCTINVYNSERSPFKFCTKLKGLLCFSWNLKVLQ